MPVSKSRTPLIARQSSNQTILRHLSHYYYHSSFLYSFFSSTFSCFYFFVLIIFILNILILIVPIFIFIFLSLSLSLSLRLSASSSSVYSLFFLLFLSFSNCFKVLRFYHLFNSIFCFVLALFLVLYFEKQITRLITTINQFQI